MCFRHRRLVSGQRAQEQGDRSSAALWQELSSTGREAKKDIFEDHIVKDHITQDDQAT
jgi:hypothetical protein